MRFHGIHIQLTNDNVNRLRERSEIIFVAEEENPVVFRQVSSNSLPKTPAENSHTTGMR